MKKSLDVLILFALVTARIRIDTLANIAAFPERLADVQQLVQPWWPAWSLLPLTQPPPEMNPVSVMLIATAVGLLALYLAVDIFSAGQVSTGYRLKLALLYGIIGLLAVGNTVLLINLRQLRGPASYSHDGGVIQTEVTITYFLQGLNPYVEDYVDTPMAEWGFSDYRTALYHYPYLPWTFVFSAPFYLLSQSTLGWFDQRMVYLLLFGLTLIAVHQLVQRPQEKLIALAVVGLNPIGAVSLIFGENDPFVFAWIVLALWLLRLESLTEKNRYLLSSAALGLACASKPTAWFLAPFWLLYLLQDRRGGQLIPPLDAWRGHLLALLRRAWTLPAMALLVIGPWFIWNPDAMVDDVWRWSSGQGSTGYQIWGWGASNYVLGLGLVESRFDYWPFIIPGALITVPLLWFLLRRQARNNTISSMLYGYVVLLLAFFYVSRFLQPNYLGYMLGFLALAMMVDETHHPESIIDTAHQILKGDQHA